jgi:hypothetical protein
VVAVCGDAAFTCGITLEALNNVVSSTKRLIVILNDNEWSIAKNVGAIASYLNNIVANPGNADCFTYQEAVANGKNYVVDVAITLTVQSQDKDPITQDAFQVILAGQAVPGSAQGQQTGRGGQQPGAGGRGAPPAQGASPFGGTAAGGRVAV